MEFCKLVDDVRVTYPLSAYIYDLAVAADGTMYLCDAGTHIILKRTTNGIVTLFSGGTRGYKDGKGTDAQFDTPTNIAIDSLGNLYVGDSHNFRIRKITPDGTVTTIAGSSTSGFNDGAGAAAQFRALYDVIVADNNTLLVADDYRIRRVDLTTNQVTTIAGSTTYGYVNGPALSAKFYNIAQITISNGNIYTIEDGIRRIRQIAPL